MSWEYLVREFRLQDSVRISLLEDFLNETGREGWELVNVLPSPTDTSAHLVYLRRTAPGGGMNECNSGLPADDHYLMQ
jgi:hypothetical protein